MNARTNRRPASKAEVDRAMAQLQTLYQRSPLERAQERVRLAKIRWTEAAEAAQRGDRDAGELADNALVELNAARAELRAIQV